MIEKQCVTAVSVVMGLVRWRGAGGVASRGPGTIVFARLVLMPLEHMSNVSTFVIGYAANGIIPKIKQVSLVSGR